MNCEEKRLRDQIQQSWGVPVGRVKVTRRGGRVRVRVSLPEGVRVDPEAGEIRRGVLHVRVD